MINMEEDLKELSEKHDCEKLVQITPDLFFIVVDKDEKAVEVKKHDGKYKLLIKKGEKTENGTDWNTVEDKYVFNKDQKDKLIKKVEEEIQGVDRFKVS